MCPLQGSQICLDWIDRHVWRIDGANSRHRQEHLSRLISSSIDTSWTFYHKHACQNVQQYDRTASRLLRWTIWASVPWERGAGGKQEHEALCHPGLVSLGVAQRKPISWIITGCALLSQSILGQECSNTALIAKQLVLLKPDTMQAKNYITGISVHSTGIGACYRPPNMGPKFGFFFHPSWHFLVESTADPNTHTC